MFRIEAPFGRPGSGTHLPVGSNGSGRAQWRRPRSAASRTSRPNCQRRSACDADFISLMIAIHATSWSRRVGVSNGSAGTYGPTASDRSLPSGAPQVGGLYASYTAICVGLEAPSRGVGAACRHHRRSHRSGPVRDRPFRKQWPPMLRPWRPPCLGPAVHPRHAEPVGPHAGRASGERAQKRLGGRHRLPCGALAQRLPSGGALLGFFEAGGVVGALLSRFFVVANCSQLVGSFVRGRPAPHRWPRYELRVGALGGPLPGYGSRPVMCRRGRPIRRRPVVFSCQLSSLGTRTVGLGSGPGGGRLCGLPGRFCRPGGRLPHGPRRPRCRRLRCQGPIGRSKLAVQPGPVPNTPTGTLPRSFPSPTLLLAAPLVDSRHPSPATGRQTPRPAKRRPGSAWRWQAGVIGAVQLL